MKDKGLKYSPEKAYTILISELISTNWMMRLLCTTTKIKQFFGRSREKQKELTLPPRLPKRKKNIQSKATKKQSIKTPKTKPRISEKQSSLLESTRETRKSNSAVKYCETDSSDDKKGATDDDDYEVEDIFDEAEEQYRFEAIEEQLNDIDMIPDEESESDDID